MVACDFCAKQAAPILAKAVFRMESTTLDLLNKPVRARKDVCGFHYEEGITCVLKFAKPASGKQTGLSITQFKVPGRPNEE